MGAVRIGLNFFFSCSQGGKSSANACRTGQKFYGSGWNWSGCLQKRLGLVRLSVGVAGNGQRFCKSGGKLSDIM